MLAYFCLAKFKFGGVLQSLNPSLEVGLSKRKQTRWNIKEKNKNTLRQMRCRKMLKLYERLNRRNYYLEEI